MGLLVMGGGCRRCPPGADDCAPLGRNPRRHRLGRMGAKARLRPRRSETGMAPVGESGARRICSELAAATGITDRANGRLEAVRCHAQAIPRRHHAARNSLDRSNYGSGRNCRHVHVPVRRWRAVCCWGLDIHGSVRSPEQASPTILLVAGRQCPGSRGKGSHLGTQCVARLPGPRWRNRPCRSNDHQLIGSPCHRGGFLPAPLS